eukprot:766374-Hanusia_phi.AAC.3
MSIGWLYCLSNPAMPGLLKIGKTASDPYKRACQLYTTSVPHPFKIELAKKVDDFDSKERLIQSLLEKLDKRYNNNREFFCVELSIVKNIFDLIEGEDYTYVSELKQDSKIRHIIPPNDIWYGQYDKKNSKIIYKKISYTFNEFITLHYCTNQPSFNGTKNPTCEYLDGDQWYLI